jgi:hypothetical protein
MAKHMQLHKQAQASLMMWNLRSSPLTAHRRRGRRRHDQALGSRDHSDTK